MSVNDIVQTVERTRARLVELVHTIVVPKQRFGDLTIRTHEHDSVMGFDAALANQERADWFVFKFR